MLNVISLGQADTSHKGCLRHCPTRKPFAFFVPVQVAECLNYRIAGGVGVGVGVGSFLFSQVLSVDEDEPTRAIRTQSRLGPRAEDPEPTRMCRLDQDPEPIGTQCRWTQCRPGCADWTRTQSRPSCADWDLEPTGPRTQDLGRELAGNGQELGGRGERIGRGKDRGRMGMGGGGQGIGGEWARFQEGEWEGLQESGWDV
jgi:hypothetical protein